MALYSHHGGLQSFRKYVLIIFSFPKLFQEPLPTYYLSNFIFFLFYKTENKEINKHDSSKWKRKSPQTFTPSQEVMCMWQLLGKTNFHQWSSTEKINHTSQCPHAQEEVANTRRTNQYYHQESIRANCFAPINKLSKRRRHCLN